jgi:hypothetical protein
VELCKASAGADPESICRSRTGEDRTTPRSLRDFSPCPRGEPDEMDEEGHGPRWRRWKRRTTSQREPDLGPLSQKRMDCNFLHAPALGSLGDGRASGSGELSTGDRDATPAAHAVRHWEGLRSVAAVRGLGQPIDGRTGARASWAASRVQGRIRPRSSPLSAARVSWRR